MAAVLLIATSVRLLSAGDVITDHDGDVDHLIAICPADSYLEPATRATQLFLERLGARDIPIAQGYSEGANPFPAQWRSDAGRVLGVPQLVSISAKSNPVVAGDAQAAAEVVRSGIPITLVALDATNRTPLTRAFLDRLAR